MVWTNPCVDILESISAPKKQVLLCCRLGKPANPGDRDNFPIFFRRGKMPMGAYKVEGPQAQARKKNELLSWRLRRCLFAFERVYSLQVSITEKERKWNSGTRHLSGYWDFGWFPFASTDLGAIWSQGLCTATTSKSIWLWLASMMRSERTKSVIASHCSFQQVQLLGNYSFFIYDADEWGAQYISIHKSEGSFSLNVSAFWRRLCTPMYNSSSLFCEKV